MIKKTYKIAVLDPDSGEEVFLEDLNVTIDSVHSTVFIDNLIHTLFIKIEEAIGKDLWL